MFTHIDEKYGYDGELGAIYSSGKTEFKVWAPEAQAANGKGQERRVEQDRFRRP